MRVTERVQACSVSCRGCCGTECAGCLLRC